MCQAVFYMLLTYELIKQCNNLKSNLLYILTDVEFKHREHQESKRNSESKQFVSKICMLGHNT